MVTLCSSKQPLCLLSSLVYLRCITVEIFLSVLLFCQRFCKTYCSRGKRKATEKKKPSNSNNNNKKSKEPTPNPQRNKAIIKPLPRALLSALCVPMPRYPYLPSASHCTVFSYLETSNCLFLIFRLYTRSLPGMLLSLSRNLACVVFHSDVLANVKAYPRKVLA